MAAHADFLVLGSGVAGMWFALRAARTGTVRMITKRSADASNSSWAQGGIAAVWSAEDSYEQHIEDTLVAGAGLCRRDAVEVTVREAPARIRDLLSIGTKFTTEGDHYDLHREGGHSHRRILHAADLTGQEMVRAQLEACRADPNIEILEDHCAVDLITHNWLARRTGQIPLEEDVVTGVYALDRTSRRVEALSAKVVVLATGGAGKVYLYTTNPGVATGDGVAMAWRAGARIANMEFVQFHPTCLFHPAERSFLISEALRGEGGRLLLADGTRFMSRYDERLELAPRDIVARAIDAELKRTGAQCVFLDMTHLDRAAIEHHFPNIDARLRGLGIDMAREPIPVVPAAHYQCGGVQTDLTASTSIRHLYAIGEVACTGLHGANRLASNSLLEAMVFADRAANTAIASLPDIAAPTSLPGWDSGSARHSDEAVVITQTWEEIRRFMWNYVGIVRTHRRLERARRRLALVADEINQYYWDFEVTPDLVELRNLVVVADLIVQCALRRRESRGLHYTLDFPDPDPRQLHDTVIQRPR
jgi:L-aspartate oxidase